MEHIESDATYCSEVEKENFSKLRRSKRLSQKLNQCFRSDEDPVIQRFEEIHRMVENDTCCKGYTNEDWCKLKTEVNSLKNSLRCVARSKLTFVIKKIEQRLRFLKLETNLQDSSKLTNESAKQLVEGISTESVNSPNVLAGMITELLTEIPPYQPEDLSRTTAMTKITNLNTELTECTQVNPLDLRKKLFEVPGNVFTQARPARTDILREKNGNADSLGCTTIDLTEVSQHKIELAHSNDSGRLIGANKRRTSVVAHTSKWSKYLPTQHKPQETCEKTNVPLHPQIKQKSFKQSLIKLYKDIPINSNTTTNRHKNSNSPSKSKSGRKLKHKHNLKRHLNPQYLRNTESVFRRDFEFDNIQLRNIQTEPFVDLEQESSSDDFAHDLLTFSDDKSSVSLPFSLKKSFKKVFGTDILNDVLGCEKIVYSLTERHVEQLAKAVNIEKDTLKTKIETILLGNECVQVNDDVQSDPSVLECSQSPTPRLYPSQRPQIQK